MPIAKNHQDLPRARRDGMAPSRNPFIVAALAAAWEKWHDEHREEEYEQLVAKRGDVADAGPWRGSMTNHRCDRKLYYAMSKTPESDPMTLAGKWTTWLGRMIHRELGPILVEAFPGSRIEALHDFRSIGIPGFGYSDVEVVYQVDDMLVMVELKTTGGYSYKKKATNFDGPPEGPQYGWVLQAAMAAKERGIDKFVVLLLGLEPVSPKLAQQYDEGGEAGRFMVEWHFSVAQLEDQIQAEIERINAVASLIEFNASAEAGGTSVMLPTRRLQDPAYPDGAVVQRPLKGDSPWIVERDGQIVDSGDTWLCGYCNWFTLCKGEG